MLLTSSLLLAVLSSAIAPDTTRYVVTNHGRPAGEMLVVRDGESLVVRYYYTDRNRGQRVETRYRLNARGDVVSAEARPLGADFRAGEPQERFEIAGDSVRWQGSGGRGGRGGSDGGRMAVAVEAGSFQ